MGQQSEEEGAQHTSLGGPCVQCDGAGCVNADPYCLRSRAVVITAISQYHAIDEHNRRGMQQPRYFLFFFRKVTPFSFYTYCICTEY